MAIVMLCDRMHWDYEQYWRQPDWFLETLHIKLEEDARYQESQKS